MRSDADVAERSAIIPRNYGDRLASLVSSPLDLHAQVGPASLTLSQSRLIPPAGRDYYSGWYLSDTSQSWTAPAEEAFQLAIATLSRELNHDEYQQIWLRDKSNMQGVLDAVLQVQAEYQKKSGGSRLRAWLTSCSQRIMYYGAVFDTFSQHHPEYVSLAWGAMKFLLMAVLNHEELLTEISKAISKIADVLPRTELHSVLYPTERMKEAVALTYAKIIEFFLMAIKWYKKSKLMQPFSALIKPFSLAFRPIVDEITERSRRVDELANAGLKAEVRDLHIHIQGLDAKLHRLSEMVIAGQALQNEMLLDFRDQKQSFRMAQLEKIRDTILLENVPSAEDTLAYCHSMRNRRRQRLPSQTPNESLSKLRAWIADPTSSMLLAEGNGIRSSSLDFAADFLDAVLEANIPTIWVLPSMVENEEDRLSVTDVLRSLVLQAVDVNHGTMTEGVNPVSAQHFKTTKTTEQWFRLLRRCLSSFKRLFIIIDMSVIERAAEVRRDYEDETFKVSDFIEAIQGIIEDRSKGGLKVVFVSWRFGMTTSLDTEDIFEERKIFTDRGAKVERMMRHPKFRAMYARQNRYIPQRFRSIL